MRYFMRIAPDPLINLPLTVFGVSRETAYVDLNAETLLVKEGTLFHDTFALNQLGQAKRIPWEWYAGLGIRTDFQGMVAPITSYENAIEIPLLQPKNLFISLLGPLGLQVSCRRLVISLQEVDAFLEVFNAGRTDLSSGPKSVVIE